MDSDTRNWQVRRGRLAHDLLRNRLSMELRAIKRAIEGSVTKDWDAVEESAIRAEKLGAEIAGDLSQLLEEMPVSMSPRNYIRMNHASRFDDEQQAVIEWVSDSAHDIWMESAGIGVAIIEGRDAIQGLSTALAQLERGCRRPEARERLLTYVDASQSRTESLAIFVSALPRNPGLCFPTNHITSEVRIPFGYRRTGVGQ